MLTLSKGCRSFSTSNCVPVGSATVRFGVLYWLCPFTASEKLLFCFTSAPPMFTP
jgi:hypothetical protein